SFAAGADRFAADALRSAEFAVGGTAPFASGAAFKFDGFEVDALNFGSATFDASGLTAASASECDDGRVALATVGPDLRLPNTSVWNCGIAVPAPKQASAPATVKIDLSGDRSRPSVGRGINSRLVARVDPLCEVPPRSDRADGYSKLSCRSDRSRGSSRFEGSSS